MRTLKLQLWTDVVLLVLRMSQAMRGSLRGVNTGDLAGRMHSTEVWSKWVKPPAWVHN